MDIGVWTKKFRFEVYANSSWNKCHCRCYIIWEIVLLETLNIRKYMNDNSFHNYLFTAVIGSSIYHII